MRSLSLPIGILMDRMILPARPVVKCKFLLKAISVLT